MNPAFLALSAANPGLLPLAVSGGSTGHYRNTSRPVRWETDDETLTRVQRAWAVRERKRLEAEAFAAWMAVPGNDVIFQRQLKTMDRINAEMRQVWKEREDEARAKRQAARKAADADFAYFVALTRFIWIGIAAVAALFIDALGAPLVASAALFAVLIFLMWRFIRANREEHQTEMDYKDATTFRHFHRRFDIYAKPGNMGPNWPYDYLDELDPAPSENPLDRQG